MMSFTNEMIKNYGHLQPIMNGFYGMRQNRWENRKKKKNLCPNAEKEDVHFGQFRENISFLLNVSIDRQSDGHARTQTHTHTHLQAL